MIYKYYLFLSLISLLSSCVQTRLQDQKIFATAVEQTAAQLAVSKVKYRMFEQMNEVKKKNITVYEIEMVNSIDLATYSDEQFADLTAIVFYNIYNKAETVKDKDDVIRIKLSNQQKMYQKDYTWVDLENTESVLTIIKEFNKHIEHNALNKAFDFIDTAYVKPTEVDVIKAFFKDNTKKFGPVSSAKVVAFMNDSISKIHMPIFITISEIEHDSVINRVEAKVNRNTYKVIYLGARLFNKNEY